MMNTLKTALITATVVFAGPALAEGVYMPLLTFPDTEVAVTKADARVTVKPTEECSQLERGAGMGTDTCGSLTLTDVAERKFARD